jgi:TPR repeat protein
MRRKEGLRRGLRRRLELAAQLATGDGTEIDLAAAAKIYRREMVAGSDEAAFNLATMYARGEGVPRSWPTAVRLFKRAERLGSTDAGILLAELHLKGTRLVRRDVVRALFHSAVAFFRGDPRGVRLTAQILADNSTDNVKEFSSALARAAAFAKQ